MDCGGINARLGGALENQVNHHEFVYLSDPDFFFHTGTFSVDTRNSVNGSVFGTSGKIISGKYHWQGDNLILTTDNKNVYVFSQSEIELTLISGFENSTENVNQFKYLHQFKQC